MQKQNSCGPWVSRFTVEDADAVDIHAPIGNFGSPTRQIHGKQRQACDKADEEGTESHAEIR